MIFFNLNDANGVQGHNYAKFFTSGSARFRQQIRLLSLTLLLALVAFNSQAQHLEIEQSYSPAGAQTGDTISMELAVSPSAAVSGFTVVLHFNPLGYDISQVTGELQDSWLGIEENVEMSMNIDGDSITITASRPDASPQSGSGVVLTLGGLIIVDDLHTKKDPTWVSGLDGMWHTHPAITAGPNPISGPLYVNAGGEELSKVELRDLNGRTLQLPPVSHQQLGDLAKGIYFLHVETREGNAADIKLVR